MISRTYKRVHIVESNMEGYAICRTRGMVGRRQWDVGEQRKIGGQGGTVVGSGGK